MESIIGQPADPSWETPVGTYRRVLRAITDADRASRYREILERRYSTSQIEALETAVSSNLTIRTALGVSPLQEELKGHIAWAESTVNNLQLPWRDPETNSPKIRFQYEHDM